MRKRNVLGLILVAVVWVGVLGSPVEAAPPWESLLSMHRVEADPEKSYKLDDSQGPWLILASTFSGQGAEDQAHELVLELRRRYKWPAYVHKMRFDFGKDADGRGLNRFGQPIKWTYRRGSEIEEIGVLVGDFPSVDDPQAKKILKDVKFARPDCLVIEKGKKTNQSLAFVRALQASMLKSGNTKKKKGPMGHAFMVRNPLLQGHSSSSKALDPFVVKMNQGVKHSLLDCPGKYTVQVAHFSGKVVVDQSEITKIEKGEKRLTESRLHEAALKAHRLTELLREKGYDAYEFHDRQSSMVTVGSFNSVGTPRMDGKIEINPTIHRIIETFKGTQPPMGGPMMARQIEDIPLDIQPLPVEVPRQSIGASYARQSRGLW
ncbi:MAG: hypothetical protein JW888_12835 [Pirellulales bacterium]|nr:hypothetical protein [Pirellulales bacterium]